MDLECRALLRSAVSNKGVHLTDDCWIEHLKMLSRISYQTIARRSVWHEAAMWAKLCMHAFGIVVFVRVKLIAQLLLAVNLNLKKKNGSAQVMHVRKWCFVKYLVCESTIYIYKVLRILCLSDSAQYFDCMRWPICGVAKSTALIFRLLLYIRNSLTKEANFVVCR